MGHPCLQAGMARRAVPGREVHPMGWHEVPIGPCRPDGFWALPSRAWAGLCQAGPLAIYTSGYPHHIGFTVKKIAIECNYSISVGVFLANSSSEVPTPRRPAAMRFSEALTTRNLSISFSNLIISFSNLIAVFGRTKGQTFSIFFSLWAGFK